MTAFGLLQTYFSSASIAVGLPAISGTDSGGAAVIGTQVALVFGAGTAAGVIERRLDGSVIAVRLRPRPQPPSPSGSAMQVMPRAL